MCIPSLCQPIHIITFALICVGLEIGMTRFLYLAAASLVIGQREHLYSQITLLEVDNTLMSSYHVPCQS